MKMNFKEYADKHKAGELSDQEWEQLTQSLVNAKFDRERQKKLEASMENMGIHRTPKPTKTFNLRRVLAIAATVLLLITAGWFVFSNTQSNAQQLAQEYLEQPFRLNEGTVRGENEIEKNRGKAIEAYNNQNFEKALEYIQVIESEGQAKAVDFFQMGLCLMYKEQSDYKNALAAFDKVRSLDATIYKDEINWLSGLCLVILGEGDLAKDYLNKVVESRSSRQQEAAMALLEKLN